MKLPLDSVLQRQLAQGAYRRSLYRSKAHPSKATPSYLTGVRSLLVRWCCERRWGVNPGCSVEIEACAFVVDVQPCNTYMECGHDDLSDKCSSQWEMLSSPYCANDDPGTEREDAGVL